MLDFTAVAGSTFSLEITVETDLDIQAATAIVWTLGECCDSEPKITKTLGAGVTALTTKKFRVDIDPADTQDLSGKYCHGAWVTAASGGVYPVREEDGTLGEALIKN